MAEPVIRSRVRTAFRALTVARGVECALIGSGTALVLLAVLVWEGTSLDSFAPWVLAAMCALLALGTWWFEHRPKPDGVARRLDRRLGMDGMLFTAWEAERHSEGLGGLLSERVATRVPRRRALDAVLPASAPLLVLPFLGAGMLAFAMDVRGDREDPTQRLLELTRDARGHIANAKSAEELSPEAMGQLKVLDEASDALLTQLKGESPTAESPNFDALLEEIGRLREELAVGEDASRALDHAEELLEAARLALREGEESSAGGGLGVDSPDMRGAGGGRSGARGGTISELDPSKETSAASLEGGGWSGPEGALGPGTYWPEQHRGVVRRWIELERTQALESDD